MGSPPNIKERQQITKEIFKHKFFKSYSEILNYKEFSVVENNNRKLISLNNSKNNRNSIIQNFDIDKEYIQQIKNLILRPNLIRKYSSKIKLGYSAIHGTGFNVVSKLLDKLGFDDVKYISKMNLPDPFFSTFPPNQILDPGDTNIAKVVINEFIKEYGKKELQKLDMLFFNDPDADRLGFIINSQSNEKSRYREWKLLNANDVWALLLWYIITYYTSLKKIKISNRKNMFIVKSFVTSDLISNVAEKFQIECINGNVGFTDLSEIVKQQWKKGKINLGIFEESNGFTIAGRPKNSFIKSHILEKDGILARLYYVK